ncbi:MAG: pilus assembly protein N-terminal domain-containing protein [Pirellulaceae bacterium]|nr:pilus assembly protein N-terminal domain-containing protein [Pirellulaceae bacterium]
MACPALLFAQKDNNAPGVKFKVLGESERMTMIVNTSRIVEFPFEVPKMLVNNPDLVRVVPLSPKSIQVSALKQGTTQLNVWSSDDAITSIDIVINGDVQELEGVLKTEFPDSALRLRTLNSSLHISGFVPKAESVSQIVRIAQDYFPNVINGMTVGGVQQVVLHVKVMEVSRTKLRSLGFDWANISSNGFVIQGASGLVGSGTTGFPIGASTFRFGIADGSNNFQGFLEALERNSLATLLSEPTLTTVSGRPASFLVGGQIPIPVPQSLGVTTIEYRDFGTRLDFVPIVLGNGKVRLDVRAEVTEIDPSIGAAVGSGTVPGFRSRNAETGAEMKTGQTMAIAGLVFKKRDAAVRGFPWLMDVPWVGAAFRRTSDTENELELIIMVTPEFSEAMDASEVPPCGPGQLSTSPTDVELYYRGYLEVPKPCGNENSPPGFQGKGKGHGHEELPAPITNGSQSARRPTPAQPAAYPPLRTAQQPRTAAIGTGATPAKTVSASQNRSSPTNASNPAGGVPKPSAGAKPKLIGPLGYDDLR